MRYGFESMVAINLSGSATTPVWTPINQIIDDVTIEDDSDEIEAGTRQHGGVKQTVRARLSRGVTLPLETPDTIAAGNPLTASTAFAALLGAARARQAIVDICLLDNWTLNEAGTVVTEGDGIRMLAFVKASDAQPFGDRCKTEFECKPGRAHPTSQAAYVGVAPLDLAYAFAPAP